MFIFVYYKYCKQCLPGSPSFLTWFVASFWNIYLSRGQINQTFLMALAILSWWEWLAQLKTISNMFPSMFVVLVLLHFHLDRLELIDWLIRIFLFLPLPPSPPLSSFPPWHLLLFCLLLIRKNIFNGYISQSHMNAPFYVPSKEHSLQSGYDSSLFPSQSFRQQLGSREQEAGESWAAHPDLAQTPCGSRDFEMSSSRLRPVSDFR